MPVAAGRDDARGRHMQLGQQVLGEIRCIGLAGNGAGHAVEPGLAVNLVEETAPVRTRLAVKRVSGGAPPRKKGAKKPGRPKKDAAKKAEAAAPASTPEPQATPAPPAPPAAPAAPAADPNPFSE